VFYYFFLFFPVFFFRDVGINSPRNTRNKLGYLLGVFPFPYPILVIFIGGISPNVDVRAEMMAAPVGVTVSWSLSIVNTGIPLSSSTVAGAGNGSNPCSQDTNP
jgi:hypothetical protein